MNPKLIYEDESFFVVDKPAGWITDSSNTTSNQPVIQEWIKNNFKFEINNLEFRNGIVHRLDKETSGILLIAKTKEAFEELQRQFKERLVHKTYIALTHGKLEESKGVINEPVGRLPWRRDRFGVLPDGRDAITEYEVVSNYSLSTNLFTLLRLQPQTGRTHQIRIHLKYIGHPVVSDEFYAGRKTARHDRKWCKRLFLHAGKIKFLHPITNKQSLPLRGKEISFTSDLPEDLREALVNLVKIS